MTLFNKLALWMLTPRSEKVPQDHNTIMYGEHNGNAVRLRPVVDPDNPNVIKKWIKDPFEVAAIDAGEIKAGENAQDDEFGKTPAVETPPDLPTEDQGVQDTNPHGQNGL